MKPQRRAVRHTVVVLVGTCGVWECSGKQKFDWHVHVSDLLPSLPPRNRFCLADVRGACSVCVVRGMSGAQERGHQAQQKQRHRRSVIVVQTTGPHKWARSCSICGLALFCLGRSPRVASQLYVTITMWILVCVCAHACVCGKALKAKGHTDNVRRPRQRETPRKQRVK